MKFFSIKSVLRCGVAVSLLTFIPATAQNRDFNIPAQEATKAIPEFARQAGVQIVVSGKQLRGVKTRPVKGQLDTRAALEAMLKDTGLAVSSDDGKVITLRNHSEGATREGIGGVSGRVLDPVTGDYLRDARVRLSVGDQERVVTTNERGEFRIPDLPVGNVTVTVSYMGYPDRSETVAIEPGQTSSFDFELLREGEEKSAATPGVRETVVVTSFRDGDARAIMRQRQSMDIVNALSSESFGAIAEGNVGEFIKLMPGVDTNGEGDDTVRYVRLRGLPSEYTAVTVNGISMAAADANDGSSTSRSFSFEQMSLSSVDSIEIAKTVSADVDANAPAGTINLRTKRAFDREGRRITLQLSGYTHSDLWKGGYSGPDEGRRSSKFLPNYQGEYSDVFFNRRLGIVASISQSNTYTEMEQTYYPRSYVPTTASPEPMAPTTIYAHQRGQYVSRFAASLTTDFRATDRLILSLASIYNDAYLWSGQRTYIFTTDARTRGVNGNAMLNFTTQKTTTATAITAQSNAISKQGKGKTFIPSFEYHGDSFFVDGAYSYSDSTSEYDPLGKEGAVFNMVSSPTSTGNFSVERTGLKTQDWQIAQLSGPDWSDPASYKATNITLNTQDGRFARTVLTSQALNLSVPANLWSIPVTFKTGLKGKQAGYDFKNERAAYQYRYVGSLSTADFLTQTASANQLSFNDLDIDLQSLSGQKLYTPSNTKIGAMYLEHPDWFQHVITAEDYYTAYIANTRHFEENTTAAYFMATADFNDRVTARAGLRWEETKTRSREFDPLTATAVADAGYAVSSSTGRATTIEGIKYQFETKPRAYREGVYNYFFPSASVKVGVADNADVQLGYSRTIRRPEVNVLAGVWSANDALMVVTVPNPGLEPEISDNLSARIAYYFEPVGLVAVNYYRNIVKGLFQTEDLSAEEYGYTGTDYANYTFRTTRTVSGDSINIDGFEIEFNHAFTYLPGLLSGLSLRGSYTQTNPETPIALSARQLYSLALAYEMGPVNLNLNTVYTGRKLNSVSTGSYVNPRADMSFFGSYTIRRGLRVFVSARNLLNAETDIMLPGVDTTAGPIGDHAGDYRAYGRSMTVGVKVTL